MNTIKGLKNTKV